MAEKMIVAIPSENPGGMEAAASGHFGHCGIFTLVTVADGKIEEVVLQPNMPHEQGGCLAPVNMLAGRGVKVLIAGGMGMRPLMGFNSVGIDVFFNNGMDKVGNIIDAFIKGQLPQFTQNDTCGGGGGTQGGCGGH